ncbi:hypothetical protein TNCT_729431 [Trichonephila clavata]|uniref:Uncharacterized protein n=1 Tax=Trichonephila clavata TaxID=2740835 RepID=A0A8X6HF49_TRICU|nr:hypothetical protein TNCT_729431 [Trichonephila clavata]
MFSLRFLSHSVSPFYVEGCGLLILRGRDLNPSLPLLTIRRLIVGVRGEWPIGFISCLPPTFRSHPLTHLILHLPFLACLTPLIVPFSGHLLFPFGPIPRYFPIKNSPCEFTVREIEAHIRFRIFMSFAEFVIIFILF